MLAAPPPPDTPGGHLAAFLVTVRPDGRPHATGVGVRRYDGDLYFLSGPSTRKSRNLAVNPACAIALRLPDGLDLVLDGEAAPIDDPEILDAVGGLTRQAGPPPAASPRRSGVQIIGDAEDVAQLAPVDRGSTSISAQSPGVWCDTPRIGGRPSRRLRSTAGGCGSIGNRCFTYPGPRRTVRR